MQVDLYNCCKMGGLLLVLLYIYMCISFRCVRFSFFTTGDLLSG